MAQTGQRRSDCGWGPGSGSAAKLPTWVEHREPVVEGVLVGHRVKLAALHLPEGRRARAARLDVAQAVALPLPRAVLPAKLRPADGTTGSG